MTKFTKEELLQFNEMMLGRGMPTQDDGIGYNKADYGACATYFNGLSDGQYADLAKRLMKYCNTQLNVSKDDMKETFNELAEVANGADRSAGVSIDVTESGTLISFRYNESFINTIKSKPKRRWDGERKNWIIPNDRIIPLLNDLNEIGADVKNAVLYALSHPLIANKSGEEYKEEVKKKIEVLTWLKDSSYMLQFSYNSDIVNEIKKINSRDRKWIPESKMWEVNSTHVKELMNNLSSIATFKQI